MAFENLKMLTYCSCFIPRVMGWTTWFLMTSILNTWFLFFLGGLFLGSVSSQILFGGECVIVRAAVVGDAPEVVVTEIVVAAGAQIVHEVGATRRVVISVQFTALNGRLGPLVSVDEGGVGLAVVSVGVQGPRVELERVQVQSVGWPGDSVRVVERVVGVAICRSGRVVVGAVGVHVVTGVLLPVQMAGVIQHLIIVGGARAVGSCVGVTSPVGGDRLQAGGPHPYLVFDLDQRSVEGHHAVQVRVLQSGLGADGSGPVPAAGGFGGQLGGAVGRGSAVVAPLHR